MKNPSESWAKFKEAGKTHPQMGALVELGETYPGMKYGLMFGAAFGGVLGGGNRLASALRGAMLFAVILDLFGALQGKKSMIVDTVNAVRNSDAFKGTVKAVGKSVEERGQDLENARRNAFSTVYGRDSRPPVEAHQKPAPAVMAASAPTAVENQGNGQAFAETFFFLASGYTRGLELPPFQGY